MESVKKIVNKTEWAKIGNITRISSISAEAILFGSPGCHLGIYDIFHNKFLYYTADNKTDGEGISCFQGHHSTPVFCFSEACTNPSVFVIKYVYPLFSPINKLEGDSIEGYTNVAFIGLSYICALGNLPSFKITVWNYRTGDKVITSIAQTRLGPGRPILRANSDGPAILSEFSMGSNKITLWEILMSGKKGSMVPINITVPQNDEEIAFTQNTFTPDNSLYLVTMTGSVYSVDVVLLNSKREIDFNEPGDIVPQITFFEGSGILVSGPNPQIRHYNKVDGRLKLVWSWDMPGVKIKYFKSTILRKIYAVTEHSDIVLIDHTSPEITYLTRHEGCFNDFCMVYPMGDLVVALSQSLYLYVYQVRTGKLISTYTLKTEGLAIAGNPEFPYIGIGDVNGSLKLYSIYQPEKVKLLVTFNLTRSSINSVYFSEFGTVLVAANTNVGEFFVIDGVPGSHMKILATINARKQIADYILAASPACLRLFMIPVTEKDIVAGRKLIRYCVVKNETISLKEYEIESEGSLYYKLHATSASTRDRIFYALTLKDKFIHQIETKKGDNKARIISKIPTGHQLRKFGMYKDKHHVITWSYDGLIIVRDSKLSEFIGMAAPHHRMYYGVKRAHIDPLGKYIVSLGRNNTLTCTNLIQRKINLAEKDSINNLMKSAQFKLMFTAPTYGFVGSGKYENKTWLEYEKITKVEREKQVCQSQRQVILDDFKTIAEMLGRIITDNLNGPLNERLDMLEFNLDKRLYEKKLKENKIKCDQTEQYFLKLIASQNKVRDYLKTNFWDVVEEHGVSIHAIFEHFHVTNYPLFPVDKALKSYVDASLKRIKHERQLVNEQQFFPWKFYSLGRPSNIKQSLMTDLAALLSKESIKEFNSVTSKSDNEALENNCAYTGTITLMFITPNPLRINQRKIQFIPQYESFSQIATDEVDALRKFFNKKFNEVFQLKVRELHVMKEKTNRLRHIVSEINYFSTPETKISVEINDVDWKEDEKIENIITVLPNEISVAPYVSPSERAILDAKAAEEERIRLLLLADDFRERALMAMMNGVLEIRWEDELKKDVPIPKCMLEKTPEQYKEEDLIVVRDYEEKVKVLKKERLRYKMMLTAEYTKVRTTILESNKRFNERLEDLLLEKIKVQTAIDQEHLMMNRHLLKMLQKVKHHKQLKQLEKEMLDNADSIEKVTEILNMVNQFYAEVKSVYEINATTKEKLLEKSFRKDIMEASTIAQEQAVKLYKKRPKISFKTINSKTLLLELAKSVISKEYTVFLAPESAEYLRALDHLDMYVGIPFVVDSNLYAIICKHRRLRIELEIKCRVAQLYHNMCESCLQYYHKLLESKKGVRQQFLEQVQQAKANYAHFLQNFETQYVIKSGLVEIPCHGELEDMDDAILIRRQVVLDINNKIKAAGEKKLKSMAQTMAFRRRILLKEWQHKKMRFHIQDLELQISDILDVHVTREMKDIIRNKMKGIPDRSSYEAEIELMRESYEYTVRILKDAHIKHLKQIKEVRKKSAELDVKIADTNVDICELNIERDYEFFQRHKQQIDFKMAAIVKRKKLVQLVQKNHNEILVLQTELELLRLKTYPTLKYKIFSS